MRWIYSDSSILGQYILVAAQKDKAIEMRDKLDRFRDRFMGDLSVEMLVKLGLVFAPDTDCSNCLICGIRCHGR